MALCCTSTCVKFFHQLNNSPYVDIFFSPWNRALHMNSLFTARSIPSLQSMRAMCGGTLSSLRVGACEFCVCVCVCSACYRFSCDSVLNKPLIHDSNLNINTEVFPAATDRLPSFCCSFHLFVDLSTHLSLSIYIYIYICHSLSLSRLFIARLSCFYSYCANLVAFCAVLVSPPLDFHR